jgi:8-oxo-dGTP diphosphatase
MSKETLQGEKVAAGGVVIDSASKPPRVLLIHRERYDDWSFPKGGVTAGETIEEAALREVKEETGLNCRITERLSQMRYNYRTRSGKRRPKVVHYFLMEATGGALHATGEEVDEVAWFDFDEATRRLSYDRDKHLLRSVIENYF